MDPANAILIKTFGNIADADLAAGQLHGHDIECVIKTDDCAGMYPSLGVIQLLVAPAVAEDARRILNESSPVAIAPANLPEVAPPMPGQPTAPRVFRFNSGLLVGILLGVLLHIGYSMLWQRRDIAAWYDYDNDGVPDAEEIWKKGEMKEVRLDRNGDGRIDFWSHYRKNQPYQDETDDNFDGKADGSFRVVSIHPLFTTPTATGCPI